ncbi:hypothetical protein ASZ90_006016 [hydrocarbon metagenome]|uniref:Uncharacterized protein n=1 Tax=hydrocarbon metagenome TaxID=938273 RepID=A0A0W8FTF5_9ZZZZ
MDSGRSNIPRMRDGNDAGSWIPAGVYPAYAGPELQRLIFESQSVTGKAKHLERF